ncbi:6-hydroxymethylpterin diphosphokinase MptE-like protein [Pseudodesulfovibrio sp.]|uniref:6-hydroxymethylpterin diphosphokinase MptE-like protein n=1 Tax=unclassified Pseudodesulfovibrio TaxID=2661612 RepID=UPI003B0056BB
MENSKIAALVEIGILCRAEDVPIHGDGGPDSGPHTYVDHTQLCRFVNPIFKNPFEDNRLMAFNFFEPGTTVAQAAELTQLFVFIGAADTEEFRTAMAHKDALVFLFEFDQRVLVEFVEGVGLPRLNREGFFLFTGDPYTYNPALMEILPSKLLKKGTPAIFQTDRIRKHYPEMADRVVEYMEILHFRHSIYPVSGQFLSRSYPIREIKRDLIFDQQVHGYANIPDYLRFPQLLQLRDKMAGSSAILVAAGPDLINKLEYIRENRDRYVIIAVNNALKPLVNAGIHPHFVIINDVSLDSGKAFENTPPMPDTILVGLALSDLGGDRFRQKFIFENYRPDIFGSRECLELHGSVISTAFSLAVYLGCTSAALVGAQLCSDNPWGLNYAKGTGKEISEEQKPLIHSFPQLCPVAAPSGETLYTTPNFRDAALWLAETIRLSKVKCYNTTKQSLLFGRGIEYNEAPEMEGGDIGKAHAALFDIKPAAAPDVYRAMDFINREIDLWCNVRDVTASLLELDGPMFLVKGGAVMEQMDKNNISYLVQRFKGFDNHRFTIDYFKKNELKERGLRYYLESVHHMSRTLLQRLATAMTKSRKLAKESGRRF